MNKPKTDSKGRDISEVPQSFDHQVMLYAKNRYKKSGDIVADLKVLFEAYSVSKPSTPMIRECIANCYAKYAPAYKRGRDIQEMLGWGWFNTIRPLTPEEVMIGALSITEGKYVDPEQVLPVLVKEKKVEA